MDEWLTAQLRFPNGVTGTAGCNMARAVITDFVNPHHDDRLVVTTDAGTRTEHLGNRSSYTY